MRLNSIKPAAGSKCKADRVGRGIGCGKGKTCGRGHKGQKSRSGGLPPVGFEGGQMPLHRRLPKVGFRSRKSLQRAEIRLFELARLMQGQPELEKVDLKALRAAGLIDSNVRYVKVILNGEISIAVHLRGIGVTAGARSAIEAAGGSVEI